MMSPQRYEYMSVCGIFGEGKEEEEVSLEPEHMHSSCPGSSSWAHWELPSHSSIHGSFVSKHIETNHKQTWVRVITGPLWANTNVYLLIQIREQDIENIEQRTSVQNFMLDWSNWENEKSGMQSQNSNTWVKPCSLWFINVLNNPESY